MSYADKASELLTKFEGDVYKAWSHANKQYDRALDTENEEKQLFWTGVASYLFVRHTGLIRSRLATRTRAR